jgi:hypothetical protein
MSSRSSREESGKCASRCVSFESVSPRSERFSRQMPWSRAPARAVMKLLLPEPGAPCSR